MASWWLMWLAAAQVAGAESFYLESDPLATRDEAEVVVQAAAEEGCDGQVVRRYVRRQGWRFLYRSQVMSDVHVVRGCLERLVIPQTSLHLVQRDGARTRVVEPQPAEDGWVDPEPAKDDERASTETAEARWSTRDVLTRLLRAHAGTTDGPGAAQHVLFRFERRTDQGLRVLHTYARRGDDVFLDVQVLEGEGTSSRAGVTAGRAWLDGCTDDLELGRVREQLSRFAPSTVLRITADLAAGRLDLPELDRLHVVAVHEVGGRRVIELSFEGDRLEPPLRLQVDATTWRLVAMERGATGVEVRWHYLGWREMEDGALRPERVQVWRSGALVDDLTIQELELSPTLPEEWFPISNG